MFKYLLKAIVRGFLFIVCVIAIVALAAYISVNFPLVATACFILFLCLAFGLMLGSDL